MEDISFIDASAYVPRDADMALVLSEDALAPLAHAGDRVYLSCREGPEEGQPGAFFYQGRVYCRRWREDYAGAMILLPGPEGRAEDCIYIPKPRRESCLCLGKILL